MPENDYYFLMHLNNECAIVEFNPVTGNLVDFDVTDKTLMPMNGSSNLRDINNWWIHRPFPSTREDMKQVMKMAGAINPELYLIKNLALSMTDSYWICPVEESELRWEDVRLTNQSAIGKTRVPYHNRDSYDPNASLDGQMSKHWDLSQTPPVLVKRAMDYDSQQAVNEVFASLIHSRQPLAPEYVSYSAKRDPTQNKFLVSICNSFVEPGLEFLPAYELGCAQGVKELSDYDRYIKKWVDCGLDEDVVRKFLDYQTLTDFIISNVDRHLGNFGVLRDVNTLKFIKPAPIYDSGNSMFYTQLELDRFISKPEMLNRKIVSIYDSEEKMLNRVQNRNIVELDALPTKEETKDLYTSFGIPESKVGFITDAYQKKIEMVHEFQKGKSISMFSENKMKYKGTAIRWCSSPDDSDYSLTEDSITPGGGNGTIDYSHLLNAMQQETKDQDDLHIPSSEPEIDDNIDI